MVMRVYYTILIVILSFSFSVEAQKLSKIYDDDFDKISSVVFVYTSHYKNYWIDRRMYGLDRDVFLGIFRSSDVIVPLEPMKRNAGRETIGQYMVHADNFIVEQENISTLISVNIDDHDILYCLGLNKKLVYIRKKFFFKSKKNGQIDPVATTVILTIEKNEFGEYKINNIEERNLDLSNLDMDYDRIIDLPSCDSCPNIHADVVNAVGCDTSRKRAPDVNIRALTHRSHPYSVLGINILCGAYLSMDKAFANNNTVGGTEWKEQGLFAKRLGYVGGLSLQYNFFRLLGVEGGLMYLNSSLDENALNEQLQTFMQANDLKPNTVNVNAGAYKFVLPYLGICIGNFMDKEVTVSLALLLGRAYSNMAMLNNELLIEMEYGNNNYFQKNEISLTSDPFWMYGAKANFGFRASRSSRFNFSFHYMKGNYDLTEQNITFKGSMNEVSFDRTSVIFVGVSAGWSWRLFGHTPQVAIKYSPRPNFKQ